MAMMITIGDRSSAAAPRRTGGMIRRRGAITQSVAPTTNLFIWSTTPPVAGNQLRIIRAKISIRNNWRIRQTGLGFMKMRTIGSGEPCRSQEFPTTMWTWVDDGRTGQGSSCVLGGHRTGSCLSTDYLTVLDPLTVVVGDDRALGCQEEDMVGDTFHLPLEDVAEPAAEIDETAEQIAVEAL